MIEANAINKITVDSSLIVNKHTQIPLLFVDQLAQTKAVFSLVDKHLNLINQAENSIVLYVDESNHSAYYEYKWPLKTEGVRIYGIDTYGNTLSNLLKSECLVFVNGQKLLKSEYEIIDDTHLRILTSAPNVDYSNITIYCSEDISYIGSVIFDFPITNGYTTTIVGYDPNRYIFFKNGFLIPFALINNEGSTVTFNMPINTEVDTIEYYALPGDVSAYFFVAELGIYNYGERDYYNSELPICYDRVITFDDVARLLIDDLRPGFFVKEEEGIGLGCLEIVDTDYETRSLKCLKIADFSKDSYSRAEYFLQVPDARSILHYLSDFDLSSVFLPEILGSFQKLLLNETYDSLLRIRNLRSIENVNSKDIVKLLDTLGNPVNVTTSSLLHKHNVLEELTNFHKAAETRRSLNFYNFSTDTGTIIKIDQLYTPIRDMEYQQEDVKRYQTFKTAEELGAIERREYRYPYTDYGWVDVFANLDDAAGNTTKKHPRYIGELEDPERGIPKERYWDPIIWYTEHKPANYFPRGYQYAIMNNKLDTYQNTEDGQTLPIQMDIKPNRYVLDPVQGPNKPTENFDYGSIEEEAVNFYDYGSVEEKIKGRWVTWLDWDRPTEWYPTNHVNIWVNMPLGVDYSLFIAQFKKTFFEIASAVLYIHSTVEVYTIAKENKWEQGDDIQYGLMTAPVYHTITIGLTNDPTRQMNADY